MFKKDPIFWWASGIFVLAILLFFITQNQFWLALGIISYMLRPTLASLGLAKRHVDERQLTLHYRSGNIGFVVMLAVCVIFAVKLGAEDNHDFELFIAAIVIGLAAKGLFNVILAKNYRETVPKIIVAVGLFVALFASFHTFDNWTLFRFVRSLLPGLAIAGVGLLAKKYPRVSGAGIIAIAVAFIMFITLRRVDDFDWGNVVTAVIIGVPLSLAGIFIYRGDKKESEPDLDIPVERS